MRHLRRHRDVIPPSCHLRAACSGFDSRDSSVHRYDLRALSLDFLELLERFIPTDYEMKLIQDFEHEGRAPDNLSEEDRFMRRFGKIPRLPQRISTLTFMGNFPESVQLIQPVRSHRTRAPPPENSPSIQVQNESICLTPIE